MGLSWEKVWQTFAGEYGFVRGFPGGSVVKESACNTGDTDAGLILGSGRSVGGHGNPFQYSCLENSMDRGGWWATVLRVTKSQTRLTNTFTVFHFTFLACREHTWQKVTEKND